MSARIRLAPALGPNTAVSVVAHVISGARGALFLLFGCYGLGEPAGFSGS